MSGLEPLDAANAAATRAYLERRPYENVFVHWLLGTGRAARAGDLVVWRDDRGVIRGACYYGPQIVPNAETSEARTAFGLRLRRDRAPYMLVGSRPDVEGFWNAVPQRTPVPRLVRASQPLLALDRARAAHHPVPSRVPIAAADLDIGIATPADADDIVPSAALMIAGEVGEDPRRTSVDFHERTARAIAAGSWWRLRVRGELAFICSVGAEMSATAQIQSVWTPPAMRGRGLATAALHAICARLLERYPTVSLYVNDFNAPALALYERVGFQRVGEFATMIF